jgi:hypothetical protein
MDSPENPKGRKRKPKGKAREIVVLPLFCFFDWNN